MIFHNAQQAFERTYKIINESGQRIQNTLAVFNFSFTILNPSDNVIKTPWRGFKIDYAEIEWNWYLSGKNSVEDIKLHAKIWDKMHAGDNIVNSNYGYQWKRGNQIDYVINELRRDINSRRCFITIYDAKESHLYSHDTPCTLNIGFNVIAGKLNIIVLMRSNDLWFGFCNDQYAFSKLQQLVASELNLDIGTYYHYSSNMHLYLDFLNRN